jgi:coenzyme F420-reducing hydrogenase beta subunit
VLYVDGHRDGCAGGGVVLALCCLLRCGSVYAASCRAAFLRRRQCQPRNLVTHQQDTHQQDTPTLIKSNLNKTNNKKQNKGVALEMLRSKKVDAVVCVQSDPSDRLAPRPVVARTEADILAARGVKPCLSPNLEARVFGLCVCAAFARLLLKKHSDV